MILQAADAAAGTTPPAAVVQQFAETRRGIVAFQLHRILDVHAGFSRRHEDLVMNGVYVDGTIVKVRVVSYFVDGKPASASDVAAMATAYEHPDPGTVFAPPFDAANEAAYGYLQTAPDAIAFTSTIHDAAHGNGTFNYDSDGNVVAYSWAPNVLPPHATSGTIEDRRAQVLPGYWAVTHETQHYSGSYCPFSGSGTENVDFSGFTRYDSLDAALESLWTKRPGAAGRLCGTRRKP